ncbi:hypothetical protein PCC7424_4050 [Gloeothece citriformis PCC 7424]|uniref:Uncharacterized protein n=1 Tax=Gloeothece citriformis (strain PCC 7424) TaxID=65393 RepID=B7KL52_GLOC7|nr:hypothetical protein [Gloeothece citriformis]ACK72424.1 hypothetical protein PCC7424_4050 [Gloeothece citriformis PCC 7424]
MTTTTDSDLFNLLNQDKAPQISKLSELDQKIKKVANSIQTLEDTHTKIDRDFDRIEQKLKKLPKQFENIHHYIITVYQHVRQLNLKTERPKTSEDHFLIGIISFLLAFLIVILCNLNHFDFKLNYF